MCKSKSEGGQRCAAHTRRAYKATTFGSPAWENAAAEHASTIAGRRELEAERRQAQGQQEWNRWAALGVAINKGLSIRATNQHMAELNCESNPITAILARTIGAGSQRDLYPHAARALSVPGDPGMWRSEFPADTSAASSSSVLIADDIDTTPPPPFGSAPATPSAQRLPGSVAQVAATDDEAYASDRMAAEEAAYSQWVAQHGEPPLTQGWVEGWWVDENGDRFGTCNACGEETRETDECCPDGEVVPRDS